MLYRFTNSANVAIEIANELAVELGHNYVGTEHILYGLAKSENGIASQVLANQNILADTIEKKIIELVGKQENDQFAGTVGLTPRSKRVLERAFAEARKLGSNEIGTEHLLIGIMKEADSIAVRILLDLNMDPQKLYNEMIGIINHFEENDTDTYSSRGEIRDSFNQTPTLNQFGTDLTRTAREGKLDPVIGRKNETERVIQILSRRTKNNPCLIGEPGVGKTAVVEGLAEKIVKGDVPELLKDKRVVSVDISSMVAGAKYRGDFEERIKKSLNEVKKAKDVILFIDEIHTIVGAGSAEGAIDAANILKPLLARGEIQVIGATTLNEYRKYIEKDAALERRFQPITVEEPSKEDAILILKGIRDKYEAHHNVKITDEAIESAVQLSQRYLNDRFLPDKAIDVIDEASSKARLTTYVEPDKIKKMEEEVKELENQKEEAIDKQKFEEAAAIRDQEHELKEKLEKEKQKWRNRNAKKIIEIKEEDVAKVISNWTGIPTTKITESENERLRKLESILHERVVGQEEAVTAVAQAIRRSRVGLKNPKKPVGSFLLLGPTGVGKTELSKALAEALFGSEDAMIRVDMSEFMESHAVSKMIGSPPGYVGYDEGGGLTEKVRRKPYSVLLFDEIEKAHPDIMNILLQILDDGRLTDATGRTVDFKNCVIIMTSNIGARFIAENKTLGFQVKGNQAEEEKAKYEAIKKEVMQELKKQFRPEFLNRIDETIVFHKLTDLDIEKIIDMMLQEVQERLQEKKITLTVEPSAKKLIAQKGTDTNYGARPLRRAIQTILENPLAEAMLDGTLQTGTKAKAIAEEGKIKIEKNN